VQIAHPQTGLTGSAAAAAVQQQQQQQQQQHNTFVNLLCKYPTQWQNHRRKTFANLLCKYPTGVSFTMQISIPTVHATAAPEREKASIMLELNTRKTVANQLRKYPTPTKINK
jgi:hypothetical protein